MNKYVEIVKRGALYGLLADGAISVAQGNGPMNVVRDMGCGATTGSVSSLVSTLVKERVTKNPTLQMTAGAVAAVLTRYGYRGVFGPPLKQEEEEVENGR